MLGEKCRGLKIRVSVVQFHPWPPFKEIAMPMVRQRWPWLRPAGRRGRRTLGKPARKVTALLGTGRPCTASRVCRAPPSSARTTRFVIVNNGSYRAPDEFAPHFGVTAPPGTALPQLDFRALARGRRGGTR